MSKRLNELNKKLQELRIQAEAAGFDFRTLPMDSEFFRAVDMAFEDYVKQSPEPKIIEQQAKVTNGGKVTALEIEQLVHLAEGLFLTDITDQKERYKIIWHFIAGQMDKVGICVEGYHRRSVYSDYAERLMSAVAANDTVVLVNVNHIHGGSVVRLRITPLLAIIEKVL